MKKSISRLISLMKKEEFELDNSIEFLNLATIIYMRFKMLMRGQIKSQGVKNKDTLIFIGRKVKLIHKKHISLGRSVTLEDYVEIDAISKQGVNLGNNVRIGAYSKVKCTGTIRNLGKGLSMGDNSAVGEYSFFGAAGGIAIGENVIMGQNIRFHSENHIFDRIDLPIREQGVTNQGISIGNDCWIGAGVVFLDGVTVGDGCVIGANTLVNKDIPPYSVAVGNPVKIVKNRRGLEEVK